VVLAWRKRIWRCAEPACGVRTWTEWMTLLAWRGWSRSAWTRPADGCSNGPTEAINLLVKKVKRVACAIRSW
jgi:hypothetical protein